MVRPPIKRLTFEYADKTFCYSSEKLKKLFGKRKSLSWRQILDFSYKDVPIADRCLAISHCLVPANVCKSVYGCPKTCPSRLLCTYWRMDTFPAKNKIKRHLERYEAARKREFNKK